jgi:nitrate/nitrite transporter NarK
MAVLAPAIIARSFAAEKHGTAMGIWSTWVPVGQVAMLLVAPALAQAAGWRAVWWFGAAYAALATLAYLVFVTPARRAASSSRPDGQPDLGARPAAEPAGSFSAVLRNRNIWLLAVAFGAFNLGVGAFATFLPTFLSTVRGLPLAQAAVVAGISTFITIFSCPAGGLLSDRIGSRRGPFVTGLVLTAVLMPLAGSLALGPLIILVVLLGLVTGLVPTNIFSAAVEATGDARLGGLAMAVIMLGQNAGMLLGPVIFGGLVETAGWSLAFSSLAVISLLGALAGWLARVR